MERIGHYINNKIIINGKNRSAPVYNPASGQQIAEVELGYESEVESAVSAAAEAFQSWSKTPPVVRARILFRFRDLVESHRDELARIITTQHGKVLSDAQGEITRGLEVVEFACGIPHAQKGEFSLNVAREVDSFSLMQPLGVCVGITPFNFPVMVPMWMFPIALACGNTFVLKPSEKDPSPSLKIAELLLEAGLPEGVFNVVNGDKQAVDLMLNHKTVQAVSFVGSTPIAEYIYSESSRNGKRCQALGGAKNHLVVMPDADTSEVVNALTGSAFGSAGERCMAISVAVCVGEKTGDRIVESLKTASESLRIGPGLSTENEPDLGPLITEDHKIKVKSYIESGVEQGAKLVLDGRDDKSAKSSKGFFIGPTIFDFVQPSMDIYLDEIFGPVLSVVRVDSLADAIGLINDHQFGNGASIFTNDGGNTRVFQEEIKVGMVGLNIPIPVPMAYHSFGGWKSSIFGPLNMHGPDGVRFFTRMKTITSRWSETQTSSPNFSMPTSE